MAMHVTSGDAWQSCTHVLRRRPFCQPLVWLAPYTEMFGDAAEAPSVHGPATPGAQPFDR
eukprot:1161756-Pelagomonas_calceolata.AAC.7